jgi:hypothetical protein
LTRGALNERGSALLTAMVVDNPAALRFVLILLIEYRKEKSCLNDDDLRLLSYLTRLPFTCSKMSNRSIGHSLRCSRRLPGRSAMALHFLVSSFRFTPLITPSSASVGMRNQEAEIVAPQIEHWSIFFFITSSQPNRPLTKKQIPTMTVTPYHHKFSDIPRGASFCGAWG